MGEPDCLIDIAELRRQLGGVSEATVYRRQADPDFPRAVQFAAGGKRYWHRSEVGRYIESRRIPYRKGAAESSEVGASKPTITRPGE